MTQGSVRERMFDLVVIGGGYAGAVTVLETLGFEPDYRRSDAPLVRGLLLRSRLARAGELGLGPDTDAMGRVKAADGRAWPNLFTLGVSRIGQLWETTAAHEIRLQAAALAGAPVQGLNARNPA